MSIFNAGLSSLIADCTKYKEKDLGVSDPKQNIEITCNSELKFTGLKKFIHQKGPEKLVKDKL